MTDPLANYADAMARYEKAREKVCGLVKRIKKVGYAMEYHMPDFLTLSYEFNVPRPRGSGAFSREHKFNMDEWPDPAALRSMLTEWRDAFMHLRDAWSLVPDERRSAMKPPPETLSPI
jgi:hypothetical protein